MIEFVKQITIHAPAEQISAYLAEPGNYPEFWDSMLECEGLTPAADASHYLQSRFVYRMAGFRLEGKAETLEFTPGRSLVTKSSGGIEDTTHWTPAPKGPATTQVNIRVQYRVPLPVLGNFAEQVILRMNEREVEVMLENLKIRFEP